MKVTKTAKAATAKPQKGSIKAYKADPGNVNKAAMAALHYAVRDNQDMVVVAGNSYMHRVFHVFRMDQDISAAFGYKVTEPVDVFVIEPSGDIYKGTAI